VLSDHGQTQGATFRQRNGSGLADLVSRSLATGSVAALATGDENDAMVGHAVREATGSTPTGSADGDGAARREATVLASGNLGLVYLLEEQRRLTLEEIEARHPLLILALRDHPHVGFLLVRSEVHGLVVLGPRGVHYLTDGKIGGEDPLADFSPNAPHHLRRTGGFPHVADIVVNSFYDPQLDEGCAFEELISFHGGLGGPQTRPFILHPADLPVPEERIVGAAGVHDLLAGWRRGLQRPPAGSSRLEDVPEESGEDARAAVDERRHDGDRTRAAGRARLCPAELPRRGDR
jgi:hypothetical protein